MCPLRVVLIFLSATLAGFFVLRGLKSQSEDDHEHAELAPKEAVPLSTKVEAKETRIHCFQLGIYVSGFLIII